MGPPPKVMIHPKQVQHTKAGSISVRTHGLNDAIAKFARRVARFIIFRGSNALNRVRLQVIKRNLVFPVRNVFVRHRPLTVQAGGQSFLLAAEGNVAMDIWSQSHFEKHELEFILSVLQPGMTFVDIGANVGLFSVPGAKKVRDGRVFAFEPSSWTYERLVKNAELNKLTNVCAVHSALGDYRGEAVLQVNVRGKDGLNTLGRPTHEDCRVVAEEVVPITTLDDFVRQNSVSYINVMKIDTEGAELLVFRGAGDLLAKPNAPLVLYEGGFLSKGFGYHPVETMWLLEKHGYSFFVIDSKSGKVSIPAKSRAYDAMVIAVKPSHPSYGAVRERAG
jgi:FkbM family methyltransferase